MHILFADVSSDACNTFPIIPHGVGVEACFAVGRDVVGWRQSKTTGETLCEKVVVHKYVWANIWILRGDYPVSDIPNTENDSELKKQAEAKKLRSMGKVHNFLEMWQGRQNLRATQKVSRAHNRQLTAIEYMSDTEDIVKASWSLFQHDRAAAFKLSKRSPLPPALSAKDLPREQIQILDVCWIWRINRHAVESDGDSAPESISDTEKWLNWNGNWENPNNSEDNSAADNESDIE